MQFTLKEFNEAAGRRIFTFEGIASDRTRSLFKVSADVALARRYGIRLQELPLLCRALLERIHQDGPSHEFAFPESEMRMFADAAAARDEAAKRKKPPRRPPTENTGSAWRVPPFTPR